MLHKTPVMMNLTRIYQQLEPLQLPGTLFWGKAWLLVLLDRELEAAEVIHQLVPGVWRDKPGFLVATDRRLLFVGGSMLAEQVLVFSYTDLLALESSGQGATATLLIRVASSTTVIEQLRASLLPKLLAFVRAQRSTSAPSPAPEPTPISLPTSPAPPLPATVPELPTVRTEEASALAVHPLQIIHIQMGNVEEECIDVQNSGSERLSVANWTLQGTKPYRFTFPAISLAPGATMRIWTRRGIDEADTLYWGRSQPAWTDETQISLCNPQGEIISCCPCPSL